MATEFNPGGPIEKDAAARNTINPPAPARETRNWGMMIAVAAIAALIVFGLLFSMRGTQTASTVDPASTPGVTTGASPSNPPPAPGPQGQGESNSKR
jgi:hypothetical protein